MNFNWNNVSVNFILIVILIMNLDLYCHGLFDLDYPIIFSDQLSKSESHFGLSVTLIKSTNQDSMRGWILIGAPKSNSTDPTYKSSIEEPGAVWRCSLGKSNNNETCEILNLDPIPNSSGQQCNYKTCQDYPRLDSKYANWLGVSMSSIDDPSGKFVTCAHRWVRGNSLMNGICYFLSTGDINRYFEGYRLETPVNMATFQHRLVPFFESVDGPNQHFIIPDSGQNKSIKWAQGQAGISTHISREETGIELLIGAPGVYVWSGAVIRYQDGTNSILGSYERKNRKRSSDFSSYMIASRPPNSYNWHHYFGYAVTSGKFDSSGQTLYVGGAPRGGKDLNGEVVIFKFGLESKTDEIYNLFGKQIASYFGSVLLAVDFNGDNVDELFVAAPLYSREIGSSVTFRKGNSGRSIDDVSGFVSENITSNNKRPSNFQVRSGDQGCVYMYSGEKQLKGEMEPFRLFGVGDESQLAGSRFGSAMSSLGDINGDGLKDIAIGAPYENDGLGAIYIYYGVKDSMPQLNQKITPGDIIKPISSSKFLQGFGSSFSAGVDIDNNGTPDLAIGSYTSMRAVILRTRPVIQIISDVQFSSANSANLTILRRGIRTFSIQSGITFTNKLGRSHPNLRVLVTLSFDAKYDRFKIRPRNPNVVTKSKKNPKEWEYTDEQISNSEIKYYVFDAELVKEHNDTDLNLPPFIVQQRVSFSDIKPTSRKGIRHYGIQGNKIVHVPETPSFDDFCSTCVGNGGSKTDFELVLSNEECIEHQCKPKLIANAYFRLTGKRNTSRIDKFIIGSAKEVVLEILVRNEGQTATKAIVEISWENKMGLQIVRVPINCYGPRNTNLRFSMNCSLMEHLRRNEEQTVEITFNMNDIFASKAKDMFLVQIEVVTSNGNHGKLLQDKTTANLLLLAEAKVKIFGSPLKKIVWSNKFLHTYEVQLEGPSPVETISLDFKIPVNKTIGNSQKPILRVTQQDQAQFNCIVKRGSYAQIGVTTETPYPDYTTTTDEPTLPDFDYPQEHEVEVTQLGRQRRDTKEIQPKIIENLKKREKLKPDVNTLEFACNEKDSSIQCMWIECTAKNVIPGNFFIVFEFTIVNETGSELLESVEKDSMLIESQGLAKMEYLESSDKDTSQTLLETVKRVEIEVWIYIVAAIGGILILIILITILYKVGFFKRETKKQLEELKAARDDARKSLYMASTGQDELQQELQHDFQNQDSSH